QPFAYGVDRGACEAHILGDAQVRHEGWILIDGDNPRAARFCRGSERTDRALDGDLTAIGRKDASDDLHQCALARPVRPHQTVNLAGAHLKRGGFERNNRVEPFGHIAGFKKKGCFAHGNPQLTYKRSAGVSPTRSQTKINRNARSPEAVLVAPKRSEGGNVRLIASLIRPDLCKPSPARRCSVYMPRRDCTLGRSDLPSGHRGTSATPCLQALNCRRPSA